MIYQVQGTKDSLAASLSEKTGIAPKYLTGTSSFRQASVATRMNWMAGRTTTEMEDIAYAMLGLLNINMGNSLRRRRQSIHEAAKNPDGDLSR